MNTTHYSLILLSRRDLWLGPNENSRETRIKTWRPETVTQMLCVRTIATLCWRFRTHCFSSSYRLEFCILIYVHSVARTSKILWTLEHKIWLLDYIYVRMVLDSPFWVRFASLNLLSSSAFKLISLTSV